MNPAARYLRRSDVEAPAPVSIVAAPSVNESGTVSTTIWGLATHSHVFALHLSFRTVGSRREAARFTPATADGISMAIKYSNGAFAIGGPGRLSVGERVAVAAIESAITDSSIDAHMAVAPLPSPGDVRICLAMGDGSRLGEWVIDGDEILRSSKRLMGNDQA